MAQTMNFQSKQIDQHRNKNTHNQFPRERKREIQMHATTVIPN